MRKAKLTGFLSCLSAHHQDRSAAAQEQYNDGLQEIDHKTAALMLYALQAASMNLKRTSLEPALPTHVVIDRESVANRPIGASAWSRVEGREYDDLSGDDPNEESDRKQPADSERLQ